MFDTFKKILEYKNYSHNTINTYIGLLTVLQDFIGYKTTIDRLDTFYLFENLKKISDQKNYAYTTKRQFLSAIKLYYKEILGKDLDISPVSPRKPKRVLPEILSIIEVKGLLENMINLKHKAMLATIYALGLRSGELINLKLKDLDGDRNMIFIQNGKGKKDRFLPFPHSLKLLLRTYFVKYKPKQFLFEGRDGAAYTSTSLRAVFNKSVKQAKIKKKVTLHSLRHSYATHLLESGTDIRLIQNLLGHTDIKTTLIYTHVSQRSILNVTSPLDFLGLEQENL